MLKPQDVCRVVQATSKPLTVDAGQAGYGIASGRVYESGQSKLDSLDRGGKVLVYWKTTTVDAFTEFGKRPPTPDDIFAVDSIIRFEVVEPQSLLHQVPAGQDRLTRDEFAKGVRKELKGILSQLIDEYNPHEMVAGPAQPGVEAEVAKRLDRIYSMLGFRVVEVVLKDAPLLAAQYQLNLLIQQIKADADTKNIAIGQAFREMVRDIEKAAEDDPQVCELATRIAGAESFDRLEELAAQEMAATSPADSKKYAGRAARRTEPVVMECHGRFAVLSAKHDPRYYQIKRSWFFVGRDENCHVTLPDSAASSHHATVARIGAGLAIVDNASTHGTIYHGQRIAQRFIETGDVFRLGSHWVVFKLEPGREDCEVAQSLRGPIAPSGGTAPVVGASAAMPERIAMGDGSLTIVRLFASSGQNASTNSRPLLIGHDSACNLRLEDDGSVARYQAIVCWDAPDNGEAGVFVEDLHGGCGTVRNGKPIVRARLANGDALEVGGHRITVNLDSNIRRHAEALHAARYEQSDLAVTSVDDAAEGRLLRFALSQDHIVLGRDPACDVVFDCDEISSRHAEILRSPKKDAAGRPVFTIADLGSTNGTELSGSKLKPRVPRNLRPGDVIRLGTGHNHRDLLVHHDL